MSGEDQLAVLCHRMGDESDPVRSVPAVRSTVDGIVARLRSGTGADRLVADLDEVDERLLRAGYAAGLSPTRIYRSLPGDGHPVLEVLACPAGACPRVELPRTGAACAVFG